MSAPEQDPGQPRPLSGAPCQHRTGQTDWGGGAGGHRSPEEGLPPHLGQARVPRRREALGTAVRPTGTPLTNIGEEGRGRSQNTYLPTLTHTYPCGFYLLYYYLFLHCLEMK